MERYTIGKRLANSRQSFFTKIEHLTETELTQYTVEGDWTIKDLIAHITTWDKAILTPLQEFARGKNFKPEYIPDHLTWNETQTIGWRTKNLATILDESFQTRQALSDLTATLTNEQCRTFVSAPWGGQMAVAEMLRGLAWHEEAHAKTIDAWLKNRLK